MNTGALEASLNTPVLERRWTFFAGTAVEVLVISMIVGNCMFVLGDAETVVRAEEDGSTTGSTFVRTLATLPTLGCRSGSVVSQGVDEVELMKIEFVLTMFAGEQFSLFRNRFNDFLHD